MKEFLKGGVLFIIALFVTSGLFAGQTANLSGDKVAWANGEAKQIVAKYPVYKGKEANITDLFYHIAEITNKEAWTPHDMASINEIKTLLFDPEKGINWKNGGILPSEQEALVGKLCNDLIDIAANPGALGTSSMEQLPYIMDDIVAIFDIKMDEQVQKIYDKVKEVLNQFGEGQFKFAYFHGDKGLRHQDAWERLIENPLKMILDRNECFKINGSKRSADYVASNALNTISDAFNSTATDDLDQLKALSGEKNGLINFKAGPWITDMVEAFMNTSILTDPTAVKIIKYAHEVLILTVGEEPAANTTTASSGIV